VGLSAAVDASSRGCGLHVSPATKCRAVLISYLLCCAVLFALQGPVISPEQSGGVSVGFMKGILESPADKDFDGSWTVVDVRDVAAAHLLAAERQAAKGR